MKTIRILLLFGILLIINSCEDIRSFNSLFEESEYLKMPELLGKWESDSCKGRIIIEYTNANFDSTDYYLKVISDKHDSSSTGYDTLVYQFSVGKVGSKYYCNLTTVDNNLKGVDWSLLYNLSWFFLQIEPHGDSLITRLFDHKWIRNQIDSGYMKTPVIRTHSIHSSPKLFLTGSSKELQEFMMQIQDKPEAYQKGCWVWRKVKE
jgi:hypothetical protein